MSKIKEEASDEIEIIYNPKNSNEKILKILGEIFVKNNLDKCKILYKEKQFELKENFNDINKNYDINKIIKIKLIGVNNIINASFMFYKCASLISITDISKWDTSKIP